MNLTNKTSSKRKPLFSIIMPCYNSESYIDRAIQSCIGQNFDNLELIIVNDGSTDNTLNIVNSYASQDKRIRVFSKENGGYVSAVNYGLNYINGIYFMFLGSDDEIMPSLFSDIDDHLNNAQHPDMIGFRTSIHNSDGSDVEDKNSCFCSVAEENNLTIKEFAKKYPDHSKIFFTRDTSKMYKTELLGTLRYFGEKGMDADGIFSMMFAHKAKSFLCVPTIGYIWYLREESLSGRRKDYYTQKDRINNWIKFGEEIMKMDLSEITDQEKNYLTNYFFNILKYTFFYYRSDCLKDKIIEKAKDFFVEINVFLKKDKATKELKMFVNHTIIWKYYVVLKYLFEKAKKRIIKK